MTARSVKLSLIALFTSLAVLFRYAKNVVTMVQFINFPLMFTIIGGMFFGYKTGCLVGILSYVLSDVLIFPGVWTVVDSLLAGFIGFLWGFIGRNRRVGVELFVWIYLSVFLFDILSSVLLYIVMGLEPINALVWGFIGLFLPVFGGSLVGVGPVTEFFTSFLIYITYGELRKRGVLFEGDF